MKYDLGKQTFLRARRTELNRQLWQSFEQRMVEWAIDAHLNLNPTLLLKFAVRRSPFVQGNSHEV